MRIDSNETGLGLGVASRQVRMNLHLDEATLAECPSCLFRANAFWQRKTICQANQPECVHKLMMR